ncbi:hypothetical protein VTJ83DRAFT_5906 [Remersonia thermophila]|uniref:Elongator complex protein 5 n=1 Tax=Remersonia thermophila TaxID=72144 RepID=A0ABR4D949_9PEZI
MAPSAQAHKRAHSLLLFDKLLSLRDRASPLTILLDTLEQSARPLAHEFMRRAKAERAKIIFVAYATIRKPAVADVFVKARGKTLKALAAEIASHAAPARPDGHSNNNTSSSSSSTTTTTRGGDPLQQAGQKSLILIDTLNPLALTSPHLLPAFFSAVIPNPSTSLLAVYHVDIPSTPASSPPGTAGYAVAAAGYAPDPLALLTHLATAILRVSGLHHAVEARRAKERSLPEPEWGLREGREGVLVGLRRRTARRGERAGEGEQLGEEEEEEEEMVVDMEMRRQSGRAVVERFVLVAGGKSVVGAGVKKGRSSGGGGGGLTAMLLADHPEFQVAEAEAGVGEGEGMETTFDLGLTEKQRRDREGVVLPYFDAQVEVGGGEGGRILYEMGREDDFDEEEDEI